MGTIYSSKKFKEFLFDESDYSAEDSSRWKSAQSGKNKSRDGHSSIDNYAFLESFAGGMEPEGKKVLRYKGVTVHDVDESVEERICRSDAALQSSSAKDNSNSGCRSRCPDICTSYPVDRFNTPRPLKAVTDRKDSYCPQRLHLDHNELVSIISDEEDDISTMSSSDYADAEGSSEERVVEHEITSPEKAEMESSVVVLPDSVTYGRNYYSKGQLTFFCSFIRIDVSEEGAEGTLTFGPKTVDLICIESRWLDPFLKAEVCLRFKSEHPKVVPTGQKSGILEVTFTVSDPHWTNKQDHIKLLDEQYKEKWDVDLDSYESFEDITYLDGDCGSISISKSDFQLLQPEKFINDTIVDFYIEYLKKIKPADARIHFFNSFFSRKLADFENQSEPFDAKAAFQRVRKWTMKVNIFQMDYIFIPVNFRLHWSLIVICHPGEVVNFTDEEMENSLKVPCILHMDSIKGSHRGLENRFKSYLCEEWKERSRDSAEDISTKFMNLRFLRLEVPQQQNSYDCGLFMLHFMELFVKQAPINFNPLTSFISQEWFYPTEASLKRARIKRLIFQLTKSNVQAPGSNDKSSYELKDEEDDEEEAEVEILHEKCCNPKETSCPSNSDSPTIMVKPLRSEPYVCSDMDGDIINGGSPSVQEIQTHSDRGDKGGSLNHGQLVLYDPSINVLSPIKESDDETEDIVTEPPQTDAKTNKILDKSLNLLHLKENPSSSGRRNDVHEALIVEDSVECLSDDDDDDDVFETCVVDDSDSDDDSGKLVTSVCKNSYAASCKNKKATSTKNNVCMNVEEGLKRKLPVVSEARKRPRRSSIFDLKVISP